MTCLFTMDLDSLSFTKEISIASTSPPLRSRIKDAGPVWRKIMAEDPRVHPLSPSLVINYLFHVCNFTRFRLIAIANLNFKSLVPKAYKRPEFVEELRALLTETGTVSLECKVIGVPTPVLRWFKDNKEIKAGDVFALTANPDDPTSLGVYTCEAINCMGTAYSSSKVNALAITVAQYNNCNPPIFSNIDLIDTQRKHVVILSQVHVVGRGSREGSLRPADALAPSGPLPIFKQILQDECCRIGDTIVLSCRGKN